MRPAPMTPRVFPRSSTPCRLERSHRPWRIDRSATVTLRATASNSAMVSSAAEIVLPPGAFITATPRSEAAATSMLSTPTPARPTTLRPGAPFSNEASTRVALRTIRPAAVFNPATNSGSEESFDQDHVEAIVFAKRCEAFLRHPIGGHHPIRHAQRKTSPSVPSSSPKHVGLVIAHMPDSDSDSLSLE